MLTARLFILLTFAIALGGILLSDPVPASAQAGYSVLDNGTFDEGGTNFPPLGWQRGRRVQDPRSTDGDGWVGEIRGPAGIMYQTLDIAEAGGVVGLGRGQLTIQFDIVEPQTGNSGLIVSFGGKVFEADEHRSPTNPQHVFIRVRVYDFALLPDRTLSFQVKRPGRVRVDRISARYSPSGDDEGNVIPEPTPDFAAIRPLGSLGQYPSYYPYPQPTPAPVSGLDTDSIRVSINPPILYVSPSITRAGDMDSGTSRAAIYLEVVKKDGTRLTAQEAADKDARVYFEFVQNDGSGYLSEEGENGNPRQLNASSGVELADYLMGASKDQQNNIDPKQLYFVPVQVKDAEVRILARVEAEMPRDNSPAAAPGQAVEDMDLEISKIIPISVRVAPGTSTKGTREVRGLAPAGRGTQILIER